MCTIFAYATAAVKVRSKGLVSKDLGFVRSHKSCVIVNTANDTNTSTVSTALQLAILTQMRYCCGYYLSFRGPHALNLVGSYFSSSYIIYRSLAVGTSIKLIDVRNSRLANLITVRKGKSPLVVGVRAITNVAMGSNPLKKLNFSNIALEKLPLDTVDANYRRQVPNACFSLVEPTPVESPQVVAVSKAALQLLDIDAADVAEEDLASCFSGNKLLPGSRTAAHCYCGHQFGYFSGQLGDGAAIYLGEIINRRGQRWELQIKGAGLTPYSRQADGRKVLRSSIREFLCSEAMYHLGIPTTRAGTCVTSDTKVVRDIFYSGDPVLERATIVSRIAPTFLRFGSFEIFKSKDKLSGRSGPSEGRKDILNQMLDYAVGTFFPEIYEAFGDDKENCYLEFYKEVVRRTVKLVVEWQAVGFCHGVLNTDNMSIMGITIDYGPFGFMDYFDPDHICNASDDKGRYSYQSQPSICKWNCFKFAEALQGALPLQKSVEALESIYDDEYKKCYLAKMRAKLGLKEKALEEDEDLIESLMDTMKSTAADFTNVFRSLSRIDVPAKDEDISEDESEEVSYFLDQCQSAEDFKKTQGSKSNMQQIQVMMMLMQMNPALFEQMGGSVSQLQRELEKIQHAKELEKLTQEEKSENDRKHWTKWLAKYKSRLAKEAENAANDELVKIKEQRIQLLNSNNPRFILRNHIAQKAIEAAENGDFSEVRRVLSVLEQPYSDGPVKLESVADKGVTLIHDEKVSLPCSSSATDMSSNIFELYAKKAPSWATDVRVT